MDPVEDTASAMVADWRSGQCLGDYAHLDRRVLKAALSIVGEYDSDILAGIAATALEVQEPLEARHAHVVAFRRRA
jgi:hypothetical protein